MHSFVRITPLLLTGCLVIGLTQTIPCEIALDTPFAFILDTVKPIADRLPDCDPDSVNAFAAIPEGQTDHAFSGDAVIGNNKILLTFPRTGHGVEMYARAACGLKHRATLSPFPADSAIAMTSATIHENNLDSVFIEAVFQDESGLSHHVGFEINAGEPFVRTMSMNSTEEIHITAPSTYAIIPDFFADDIVIDARSIAVEEGDFPTDNFILQPLGDRDSLLLCVWNRSDRDIHLQFSGESENRRISGMHIHYPTDGNVWISLMEGEHLWGHQTVLQEHAGKIIQLDWKSPFPAQWRVDWRRFDRMTDSWEMLVQRPDKTFFKHPWLGLPEPEGADAWLDKTTRRRWTALRGNFMYPCWIDMNGQGFLQPLKDDVYYEGPVLIYPIDRIDGTPLDRFTLVDVVRSTLGVGPCAYILDLEGQKKSFTGMATCVAEGRLYDIYKGKQQKTQQQEVERILLDVVVFLKHIRVRIDAYAEFSHAMQDYLQEQKNLHPDLSEFLDDLDRLAKGIEEPVTERLEAIKTPEYIQKIIGDFIAAYLGDESQQAYDRCDEVISDFGDIGSIQDEIVGQCRVATKRLRQRAALANTDNLEIARIAKEVRARTQEILRNPTDLENPRY